MAIMTFPPAMFLKIPAVVRDAYESDGYIDFGTEELEGWAHKQFASSLGSHLFAVG